MLCNLQTYIARRGTVSLSDLSLHFRADEQVIESMLDRLQRKGRIRRLPVAGNCSECTCCDRACLEFYEWTG